MIVFPLVLWALVGVTVGLDVDAILCNGSRIVEDLEMLRSFSDVPAPAVQRILFTEADIAARTFLRELFKAEDLDLQEDAIGNMFAVWMGSDQDLGAVGTGSHFDAIPLSGMYDGTVGVLGALEAVRALKRAGFKPNRSIEILAFTSEEPTRFGLGCLGSRVLTGQLDVDGLKRLRDENETDFDTARERAGYFGSLENVALPKRHFSAFIELHIEQGPELEASSTDLGVVTSIAAPAQLQVLFEGDGGHAGALLMDRRNDALLAGAELALYVEAQVLDMKAEDTVGTTGLFDISPGAVNSVPRSANLGIDIRDTDKERRDQVVLKILESVPRIAQKRGVRYEAKVLNQDAPATSSPSVVAAIEEAINELNYTSMRMVSRAYHDSLFMAHHFPTAMLFIPCRGGVSHRPDEFVSSDHIVRGATALAASLAKLASISSAPEHQEL